jgi:hypothetical protein
LSPYLRPPPPPTTKVVAANTCLSTAFQSGHPAELTVTNGPDDIGHTGKTFYRVVRPHTLDVIWEDIPPSGPIQAAELSDCTTLTVAHGQIGADSCHPTYPTYSP